MKTPRGKLLAKAVEEFRVQVLAECTGRDFGSLEMNLKRMVVKAIHFDTYCRYENVQSSLFK